MDITEKCVLCGEEIDTGLEFGYWLIEVGAVCYGCKKEDEAEEDLERDYEDE